MVNSQLCIIIKREFQLDFSFPNFVNLLFIVELF